jgi:hypothetical protein
MSVRNYTTSISSDDEVVVVATKAYIKGLGEGIKSANAYATTAKTPLFCPPEKLALALENYIDIINRQIKSLSSQMTQAKLEDLWIGVLVMEGLHEPSPAGANRSGETISSVVPDPFRYQPTGALDYSYRRPSAGSCRLAFVRRRSCSRKWSTAIVPILEAFG